MGAWTDTDRDRLLFPASPVVDLPGFPPAHVAHRPGGHNHDQSTHAGGKNMPPVGSAENPYIPDGYGTGDPARIVDEAAELLGQGQHVRLEQPDQVSLLADKVNEIVSQAEAEGRGKEVKGKFDACKVSVPGTNVFCAENKGIPRVQMPQLKAVPTPGTPADSFPKAPNGEVDLAGAFRDHMEAQGIKVTDETVPVSHLRATQRDADLGKVAGMMRAMESGKLDAGTIFISKDNYIIDGHHTAFANLALDARDGNLGDRPMRVRRVDAYVSDVIFQISDFTTAMGIPGADISSFNPANAPRASSAHLPRPVLVAMCCGS